MRVLASLAIVSLISLGQTPSPQIAVSLSGTVVDPAGTLVPGVALELKQGTTTIQRTTSNRAGAWAFEKVAPGSYTINAALQGFATTVMSITVAPSDLTGLKLPMKVGQAAEIVAVSGPGTESSPAKEGSIQLGISPRFPGGAGSGAGSGAGTGAGGVAGGVVGGVAGAPPSAPEPARQGAPMAGHPRYLGPPVPAETATYAAIDENRFRSVDEHPLSTFSIDVDTASYANVRRFLNEGRLPPRDAVRVEEMLNYFKYDYPAPRGDAPVAVTTEVAPCPWNSGSRVALIGVRAAPIRQKRTPPRNLTFLLDVSGSMMPPNRLPLVKAAMKMLVGTLRADDRVAIVVYAGASGVVLKGTPGDRKAEIQGALDRLQAGGSTNGAAGIQLAYDLAAENFVAGGVNRVILATDGDFNVGITSRSDLIRLIEEKRERGIFLSVLGVGDDNLQDATMEMLADRGNGNYSYLDSVQEGRRVLIAEAASTLVTVAKDVKLQIEFNPRFVSAYRLIGYENRVLRKDDFNNDRKDAGEMGAGHTVTALYEIVPPGQQVPGPPVDPLKYQTADPLPPKAKLANTTELMTVKVRYKTPDADASRLLEFPVRDAAPRMTANAGFAAAVAEFGMLLRRSDYRGSAAWPQVASLAREHRGDDSDGYRAEFVRLVEVAAALDTRTSLTSPDARR